jgi:hypothetical protein
VDNRGGRPLKYRHLVQPALTTLQLYEFCERYLIAMVGC